MGWTNHYSAKYGRCYVAQTINNQEAAGRNSDLPYFYDELFDAFEDNLLATCVPELSPSGHGAFCSIQEGELGAVDCAVCRAFIKDRMAR